MADEINKNRLKNWNLYYENLKDIEQIEMPYVPAECKHNAHMFYIKTKDLEERTKLINYLKENEIQAVFHYIPLHSAPAGIKYGRFHGEDRYTTKDSERILRLPMYYGLKEEEVLKVCNKIKEFYKK